VTSLQYYFAVATKPAIRHNYEQMTLLLFFCPEKVAIFGISGIITTNLGKTATHTEIAGRKKTDTSLQNMPFSLTGEGYFFVC
jgi:hypothetical protein